MNPPRVHEKKPPAVKKAASPPKAPRPSRRKNPRLLANLMAQGISSCEVYFETASPEDVIRLFDESYCPSLVNFLLDLKKSTTKRLFEMVVRHRKKAFLHIMTLYYYKDYLINPLPLTLESGEGRDVPNHYALLGIPREASLEEIRSAQKMLAASFGPDSFPPAERRTGEERWRELNAAFEVLKTPKRRKDLDGLLPNVNYFYPRRDQWWFEATNRMVS